jgi:DNA-binding HxlR family transcriptional regulator
MAHANIEKLDRTSLKHFSVWVIGSHATVQTPEGPAKIKEHDGLASWKEIKNAVSKYLFNRENRPIEISRRTVFRILEELENEGLIASAMKQSAYKPTFWQLTEKGVKLWRVINASFQASNVLPKPQQPISLYLLLGPKEKGQTTYINMLLQISEPNMINLIERELFRKPFTEKDYESVAWFMSLAFLSYLKGLPSLLPQLFRGKEELLSEFMEKFPIFKGWLEKP